MSLTSDERNLIVSLEYAKALETLEQVTGVMGLGY